MHQGDGAVCAVISVPSSALTWLIGTRGSHVKEMQRLTSTTIDIPKTVFGPMTPVTIFANSELRDAPALSTSIRHWRNKVWPHTAFYLGMVL